MYDSLLLIQVEELAEHGSLIAYLHKAGLRIHIELMHRYCVQISDGMSYLAKHNIVHRDLAARNVLLSKPDCVSIAVLQCVSVYIRRWLLSCFVVGGSAI